MVWLLAMLVKQVTYLHSQDDLQESGDRLNMLITDPDNVISGSKSCRSSDLDGLMAEYGIATHHAY